ncbi:MAG: tetratricopeptide repeat protein, partial [Acidobacteriales bacterium]|nr:tetratricopeptide repeat protein [Terriglobales bacterium]
GLSAAVWLVYAHTLGFPLINLDDDVYVSGTRALTWTGILWALQETSLFYWHPLTWISHMLDVQLYGIDPFGHRLTNVLLHTANVLLVFFVLRRLTGNIWPSAFVAGFFGLHPLRVESVVWLAERKDLLCALFWLLTMWAYASYAERQFSPGRYAVVVLGMVAAIMSKPMAVTLPFALLLLDVWPLKRVSPLMPRLLEKLPLLAISIAASVVTVIGGTHGGATEALPGLTLSAKLKTATMGYLSYLQATIWPHPLSILYPYDRSPSWVVVMVSLLFLAILTVFAAREWKQRRYLIVGWCWFVGVLVPVIGLVQVGMQSHADRFTYIPHIGLLWAAVWLTDQTLNQRAGLTIGIALLLAFSAAAWRRGSDWREPAVLYRQGIAATGENPRLELALGLTLLQKGAALEAEGHFRNVLRLEPSSLAAHVSLGNSLAMRGNFREAATEFTRAVEQDSDSAKAHYGLAMSLMNLGRKAEARQSFERALRLKLAKEEAALAELNLGTFVAEDGDLSGALAHFESATTLNPASVNAHRNLAITLARLGRKQEALARLDRGIGLTRQDAGLMHLRSNLP